MCACIYDGSCLIYIMMSYACSTFQQDAYKLKHMHLLVFCLYESLNESPNSITWFIRIG